MYIQITKQKFRDSLANFGWWEEGYMSSSSPFRTIFFMLFLGKIVPQNDLKVEEILDSPVVTVDS